MLSLNFVTFFTWVAGIGLAIRLVKFGLMVWLGSSTIKKGRR
ncbi:hypothetical protein HMPREF0495_00082 [Levilactobacillus brevis ATCC 14869 = DSM 20054]|uniref:Uncharacterized protein n=1 Tax=Levilactobacillus brevis ATCC 14869 = DSM 20054 TaxID=649758 RepID=U2R5S3_LEVBR|nr:hypothetical protein HMPREF0495_00082 [Levilactobacillus brevis ATCC 14869 = DSM 20054]